MCTHRTPRKAPRATWACPLGNSTTDPGSGRLEAAPVGGGVASTTGGVCVSRGAWSVRSVRSSPSCGTCCSRLASNVGQAGTLRPRTPLVLGTGAGLFRMEGRHRGVLPPYEGLPRAIARENRELLSLALHDSAYLLRNVQVRARIGHSTAANVPRFLDHMA
jgi:hypothetical protein